MTAKELAVLAAKALDSKKGEDIKIMEVTEQTTLADYFVICPPHSPTHPLPLRGPGVPPY